MHDKMTLKQLPMRRHYWNEGTEEWDASSFTENDREYYEDIYKKFTAHDANVDTDQSILNNSPLLKQSKTQYSEQAILMM